MHCLSKLVRNVFFSSDVSKWCGSKGTTVIAVTSPTLQALATGNQPHLLKQKLANAQRVEVNRETIEGNDTPPSPACKEFVSHTQFPFSFPRVYSRKPRCMQKIST